MKYEPSMGKVSSRSAGSVLQASRLNDGWTKMVYVSRVTKQIKYKKKLYNGQGAHWEWCAACFHYKFDNLTYVPIYWDYELSINPWKFMSIPEPINEKMS